MKDPLIVGYIAERAELLSRVAPPPRDALNAVIGVAGRMSLCGVVTARRVARHSYRSFLVLHHDDSRKMRASPTEPYTGHGGQSMWVTDVR